MARVDLQGVTKVYSGAVRAVNAIDLAIADKEFVVLVGPSGCGKSTTLRMIAGLEDATAGTIRIGDRVVNHVPPKDRDIAMVFQNYALYPHMTVYKNMAFALKLRGTPKSEIDRRVRDAARMLEIDHLLERKPKALSGGQRQRVAVGRAIVREPAAFLFDEPLSNLDAKLRVTTRAELKRLHHRLQTTTIYVTHDQEEAMTLGDRIVVMKDGVIHQADPPLRTYNEPKDRFVAGFIGMPPMNFFDGALRMVDGRMIFEEGALVRAGISPSPGTPGEGRGGGVSLRANQTAPPSEGTVFAGELTLPGNGFTLPIPVRLRESLAGRVGRHVVLGIRPEHFHLRPVDQDGGSCPLDVKIIVTEPLGHDMDVYMQTNLNDRVVARVEAASGLRGDQRVTLFVDLRKVHLFEPGETGMNLCLSNEPTHAIA